MYRIMHENGVITYVFESLAGRPVYAHITTRHGGVSPAPWNWLNFSVARGDSPERVVENRMRFAAAMNIDADGIVRGQQVHGTGVAKVDRSEAGRVQKGVDALITDEKHLPLMLVFADCVPVLLYDHQHHVLGICHAGWRGTVNGAAPATLWAMQAAYDTEPADVLACIGPSIGPDSYEVGDDVVALAYAKLERADRYFIKPNDVTQNAHLDLWRANAGELEAAGVPGAQIEIAAIDTAQHTDDFFSHRAERGQCGLFAMCAWLAEA